MTKTNETITIGKHDRLEIDISSIGYYPEHGRSSPNWLRIDWGWNELQPIGEEKRNGQLSITEDRLESALRAYLAGQFNTPIKELKWTWDKYHSAM